MRADVKSPSMEARIARVGANQQPTDPVKDIEVTGRLRSHVPHTVVRGDRRSFLESFSSPRAPAVIIPRRGRPKPQAGKNSFVGNRPYKFVEICGRPATSRWKRFEDYFRRTLRSDGIDGFGGKKTALGWTR